MKFSYHLLMFFSFLLMLQSCISNNLKNDEWKTYNSKNKIPKVIKEFLSYKGNFKIANPNEEFNLYDNETDEDLAYQQLRLLSTKQDKWRVVILVGGLGHSYYCYEFSVKNNVVFETKRAVIFEEINSDELWDYYVKKGDLKLETFKKDSEDH